MRHEDRREWTLFSNWSIKIPGNIESRVTLEINLLNGVLFSLYLPGNLWIERSLGGRWPKPGAHENLLAKILGPDGPFFFALRRLEAAGRVQVADFNGATVGLGKRGFLRKGVDIRRG
jgi:hypothetical protein